MAIAVDNLADAESLTAIEKEEERECEKNSKNGNVPEDEEVEEEQSADEEETDDGQYSDRCFQNYSSLEHVSNVYFRSEHDEDVESHIKVPLEDAADNHIQGE